MGFFLCFCGFLSGCIPARHAGSFGTVFAYLPSCGWLCSASLRSIDPVIHSCFCSCGAERFEIQISPSAFLGSLSRKTRLVSSTSRVAHAVSRLHHRCLDHTHISGAGWDCHGTIAAKPWAERLWPESESRLSLLVVNVWCFYSFWLAFSDTLSFGVAELQSSTLEKDFKSYHVYILSLQVH